MFLNTGLRFKKKIINLYNMIVVNLDIEMAKNKMSLTELSERVGLSMTNLSLLKTGKVKGIRFETLNALCRELQCKPGDILDYAETDSDEVGY